MDHSNVMITHLNMPGISVLSTEEYAKDVCSYLKTFQNYLENTSLPMRYWELARPRTRLSSVFSLSTAAKDLDNVPSVFAGI